MVADAYDALTSKRPYSSPVTYEAAAAEILGDDSHFDPSAVATFMAIAPEELRRIAERYQDEEMTD
jgi:response regulator RpfG family c-di-GMP phosphodiesterase